MPYLQGPAGTACSLTGGEASGVSATTAAARYTATVKTPIRPASSLVLIVSMATNAVLAFLLWRQADGLRPLPPEPQETATVRYPLLAQRIFIEDPNDIIINFIPLRTALREAVAKVGDTVGVYFEYLPSGTSIGVNDGLETHLASLMKIPLMMGIYKQLERGELKKDTVLTIKQEHLDERFGALWQRGEGTTLTVEEAVRLTLVESDNTSSNVLLAKLLPTDIDRVFDSLDVPKRKEGKFHILSPKSYASILRSLYLSSYLTQASSNEILDILTKTAFSDKLPSGVPNTIKVAHKIGVFRSRDDLEETYSDCGIVYVPKRPYILCMMARVPEETAKRVMRDVSKMVYGYVTLVRDGNAPASGNSGGQ